MSSMKRRRAERSARFRASAESASRAGSAAGRADVIAMCSLLSGRRGLRRCLDGETRAVRDRRVARISPRAGWYMADRPDGYAERRGPGTCPASLLWGRGDQGAVLAAQAPVAATRRVDVADLCRDHA